MFASLAATPPADAACARVQAWVRERYRLGDEATVLVTERASDTPGCPPLETVVAFWTDAADGSTQRHHTKVFKAAADVLADDLPPWWMKDALAVAPAWACDCC